VEFDFSFVLQTRKRDSRGRKCQQTIGDRQFVSFVQFFLHKYGEVKFGRLQTISSGNGNVAITNVKKDEKLPLADVPIPDNVKDFESICIRFVFTFIIKFLYKLIEYSAITANPSFLFCKNLSKIPC
jgi:hypothetical protein